MRPALFPTPLTQCRESRDHLLDQEMFPRAIQTLALNQYAGILLSCPSPTVYLCKEGDGPKKRTLLWV